MNYSYVVKSINLHCIARCLEKDKPIHLLILYVFIIVRASCLTIASSVLSELQLGTVLHIKAYAALSERRRTLYSRLVSLNLHYAPFCVYHLIRLSFGFCAFQRQRLKYCEFQEFFTVDCSAKKDKH